MTLGELIDTLKSFPKDYLVFIKPYDLVPHGFTSYRGYYDELALKYDIKGYCTVGDLLKNAKSSTSIVIYIVKGRNLLFSKDFVESLIFPSFTIYDRFCLEHFILSHATVVSIIFVDMKS